LFRCHVGRLKIPGHRHSSLIRPPGKAKGVQRGHCLIRSLLAAGRRTMNHGQLVHVCWARPTEKNAPIHGKHRAGRRPCSWELAWPLRRFHFIRPDIEYFVCRHFVGPHNWGCLGKVKARDHKQPFACYYYAHYTLPYNRNRVSDNGRQRHLVVLIYHYSLAMVHYPRRSASAKDSVAAMAKHLSVSLAFVPPLTIFK
jgi:hypothetical protein